MIKKLTFVISLFGYIIASMIGYFAIYPLKIEPRKNLSLNEILFCTPISYKYSYENLTNSQQEEIKNSISTKLPIEQIKNFLGSIDTIAAYVGMKPVLKIDFCDIQGTEGEILTRITDYLKSYAGYYEYGSLNEFVTSINDLPFFKITNFEINIGSAFARTKYCNASILNSKLHLFITVESPISSYKRLVLFTVELFPLQIQRIEQKLLKNLIETGNYFKSMLNCNE